MKIGVLAGALGFMAGVAAAFDIAHAAQADPELRHLFLIFGDILDISEKQYVDTVDGPAAVRAAIAGMVASLDPHSSYIPAEAFNRMVDPPYSIGLEVTLDDGFMRVIAPIEGAPAEKAGVRAGDYITEIGGQNVVGLSLEQSTRLLRGSRGSRLTLKIVRPGEDPRQIDVIRDIVLSRPLTIRREGAFGYAKIKAFDEQIGSDLGKALSVMNSGPTPIKGLVLDLRNCPGGLLDQTIAIASDFLDGGEVALVRGRAGTQQNNVARYNASAMSDKVRGLPVVVLINRGTAAGAEIVAAALQDRHRAKIVGQRSYGAGTIQTLIPLNSGRDGALKLTTGIVYRPSGARLEKLAVTPDIAVAQSPAPVSDSSEDAQLQRAFDMLRAESAPAVKAP